MGGPHICLSEKTRATVYQQCATYWGIWLLNGMQASLFFMLCPKHTYESKCNPFPHCALLSTQIIHTLRIPVPLDHEPQGPQSFGYFGIPCCVTVGGEETVLCTDILVQSGPWYLLHSTFYFVFCISDLNKALTQNLSPYEKVVLDNSSKPHIFSVTFLCLYSIQYQHFSSSPFRQNLHTTTTLLRPERIVFMAT